MLGAALLLAAWVTDSRDASDTAAMSGTAILAATWIRFCYYEWQQSRRAFAPGRGGSPAPAPSLHSDDGVQWPRAGDAACRRGRAQRPASAAGAVPAARCGPSPSLWVGCAAEGRLRAAPVRPEQSRATDELCDAILDATRGTRRVIDDLHRVGTTLGSTPIVASSRQLGAIHRHLEELLQCGV
jgi:hypothetical protein